MESLASQKGNKDEVKENTLYRLGQISMLSYTYVTLSIRIMYRIK